MPYAITRRQRKTVSTLLWIQNPALPYLAGLDAYDNKQSPHQVFVPALFSVMPKGMPVWNYYGTSLNDSPVEYTIDILSRFPLTMADTHYDDFYFIIMMIY